jgi:hypothetical protein
MTGSGPIAFDLEDEWQRVDLLSQIGTIEGAASRPVTNQFARVERLRVSNGERHDGRQ